MSSAIWVVTSGIVRCTMVSMAGCPFGLSLK
jgi:hypothetical protein